MGDARRRLRLSSGFWRGTRAFGETVESMREGVPGQAQGLPLQELCGDEAKAPLQVFVGVSFSPEDRTGIVWFCSDYVCEAGRRLGFMLCR